MIEHKTDCETFGERYCWIICQGRCSAEFWEEEDRQLIWCSYQRDHGTINEYDVIADHGNADKGVYFPNPPHMDKRQKFGLGYSINIGGNLQHLISPIVGQLDMARHKEDSFRPDEYWEIKGERLQQMWERLSFALQMIREEL